MNVLVIGSGAREHALVDAFTRDGGVQSVVCAPGNAGTAAIARNVDVDVSDPEAVAELAEREGAGLVVVGPEVPLVAGAADTVRARGIPCFGPSREAARLESSKAFAKEVMAAAGVPTALAHVCDSEEQFTTALDAFGAPYVVKDDGLAAGKGVVVSSDREVALVHARACGRVVIEEFLDGPEVSLFALSDGETVVPLLPAQDFKRAFDGDTGLNTGGMGSYTPLPWVPAGLVERVTETVLQPTIDEMRRRGTPFTGLLYAGLALTPRGVRVVEFNARFGDPETQAVLALLETPLSELLLAASTGRLAEVPAPRWKSGSAVTVVVAASGYPDEPRTGGVVDGLDDAAQVPGVTVLHAGTRLDEEGRVRASGGRVLSVTATGDTLASARAAAYEAVGRIRLEGARHRTDIALRAAEGAIEVPAPVS